MRSLLVSNECKFQILEVQKLSPSKIQTFTLHQTNLYKLQTRILHHDSFLKEVPNSGSGTPAGFLSPTRVLSPSMLSGDELRLKLL